MLLDSSVGVAADVAEQVVVDLLGERQNCVHRIDVAPSPQRRRQHEHEDLFLNLRFHRRYPNQNTVRTW